MINLHHLFNKRNVFKNNVFHVFNRNFLSLLDRVSLHVNISKFYITEIFLAIVVSPYIYRRNTIAFLL